MTEKTITEPETRLDGMVLYTDGGATPNPGFGGWGLHGYAYTNEKNKKGAGCPQCYLTDLGYVDKEILDERTKKGSVNLGEMEKYDFTKLRDGCRQILQAQTYAAEVTPLWYIDAFGPTGNQASNNQGEITALIRAFELIIEHNPSQVLILADSEHVITGFNDYLEGWARNGWKRRDGVTIRNDHLWKRLWELGDQVTQHRSFRLDWLPGHSIFLGNQIADINATIGKNCAVQGQAEDIWSKKDAQGYWKDEENDRSPLFVHTKLFFNGNPEYRRPGLYQMGSVDKDLGVLGKKISDNAFSIIRTQTPVPTVEHAIDTHYRMAEDEKELIVVLHSNTLYRPGVFRLVSEHGSLVYSRESNSNNNLMSPDRQLITEVVNPPKKSMESSLALALLETWTNEVVDDENQKDRFTVTDLTEHFYETVTVLKKKQEHQVTKLKDAIKPGMASIKVDLNYRTAEKEAMVYPTILTFGIDLPDRICFKKIESLQPKIEVWSWNESPGIFRYFSVVRAGNDIGSYCGFYSNLRLAKLPKVSKQ